MAHRREERRFRKVGVEFTKDEAEVIEQAMEKLAAEWHLPVKQVSRRQFFMSLVHRYLRSKLP